MKTNSIIKPARLKRGDTIGVISPSSPVGMEELDKAVNYLKNLEFNINLGTNVFGRRGYFSGTDEERIADLYRLFTDTSVKAVICSRGGYGSSRILDGIDFEVIKRNPKIFVGYSDITALELAIFAKTGMVTFYGPMLAPEPDGEVDVSSLDNLLPILFSEKSGYKFEFVKENVITDGTASGILVGGCLSLFCSLLGSPYLPDLSGGLLFLEDAYEEPYRIDRLLTQVKLSGVFDKVNGVLFGNFSHCEAREEDSPTVDDVISEICSELTIPVIKNVPFGHIKGKITIPMGIEGTLDTEQRFFSFDERAVI